VRHADRSDIHRLTIDARGLDKKDRHPLRRYQNGMLSLLAAGEVFRDDNGRFYDDW
jgi:hypothetical protein